MRETRPDASVVLRFAALTLGFFVGLRTLAGASANQEASAQVVSPPSDPLLIPKSPFPTQIPIPSADDIGTPAAFGQTRRLEDFGRGPIYNSLPSGSVVFFPPASPALGEPITAQFVLNSMSGQIVPAPEALADYVSESFYPALGARIFSRELDKKLDARLEAYRTKRTALINELLEQLELSANSDPADRERTLHEFSLTQASALSALEAEAEQFRLALVEGGFFSGTDWNAKREWALGVTKFPPGEFALAAEFQVMRAAACYQKGLLPEQRGLLREIAMELSEKIRPGSRPTTRISTAMFFSPETARLNLPSRLPAPLVEKIGIYNREKIALKTELRETVFAQDSAKSIAKRLPAFESLASLQRPRFVALEAMAEGIRRELALLPAPPSPPAMPYLPPELNARIASYNREKLALNTELNRRLVASRLKLERNQREAAARNAEIAVARQVAVSQLSGREGLSDADRAWIDRRYESVAATPVSVDFKKEYAVRIEALQQCQNTIRRDLAAYAHTHVDPATGKPLDPDTLTRVFNAAAERFDRIGTEEALYRNYKIATLQPGLSPAQRRLLFGAALVGLAQPLPSGEKMPGF